MHAFCDGYRAGLRRADPRECPHEKMTVEHAAWERGHRIATQYRLARAVQFEPGWLRRQVDAASRRAAEMPAWLTRSSEK